MSKLPTIAMTPMPEYGYDPIPLILSGEKKHTLRKQKMHGRKEITVGHKRTGIVLLSRGWIKMTQAEFLTDDFAAADGFRETYVAGSPVSPRENLIMLLEHFYGDVPETMWCNHFRVVQRLEEETE